jgi:signal transduction histidine kinase/CheY-like chemotaxis protein/CHASE3 domain sensor protein
MKRGSIARRVVAVFALLMTLEVLATALVLYVQRESGGALAEADARAEILHEQTRVGRALAAMQSAQRGFVITGDPSELQHFNEHWRRYERAAARVVRLIDDAEQRERFDRLQRLVADWREHGSAPVLEGRRAGRDVVDPMTRESIPRFERINAELQAFEDRQDALTRQASVTARTHVDRATTILLSTAAVSMVVLVAVIVATRRTILGPLAALSASARGLEAGDYSVTLPSAPPDEIGALVDAFADMRSAVAARQTQVASAHTEVLAIINTAAGLSQKFWTSASAHAELLAVINTMPAALVIMNHDGSIRLQNRAADLLLGRPPVNTGERVAYWRRMSVRDQATGSMRRLSRAPIQMLESASIAGQEIQIEQPDGSAAVVLMSSARLSAKTGNGSGVVAAFQDITRLRELDRLKDDFVAIVSHELRTPLTAMRGSLQLLLADDQAVPDADNRELVTVALRSCERLVRIINDMLDVAKMEAGKLCLRRKRVATEDIIRSSIVDVQPLASQAGVHFTVDVPADIPAVLADPDRLMQALVNLLSNAVKFAPAQSAVTVSAREEGDVVALSVRDRGKGIPPENLARLFQKFEQLDGTGTRRVGGTGLGLTITKAIIEEHGGTIAVDSMVGEGTTFTLRLPRATGEAARDERAVTAPVAPLPFLAARKILIVEDDEETRLELRRSLEASGFGTVEAATGPTAVERALHDKPDVIALDLMIADGDGWWVLDRLQTNPFTAAIPVVVVTGTGKDAPVSAAPIIRKPFDGAELVTHVHKVLNGQAHARVLVAGHDNEVRHMLRKALQRQGDEVVEAGDGRQALDRIAKRVLDLAIVDLHMPSVHGHDIIRALRNPSIQRPIPIIVVSGSSGEPQTLRCLELGANVFMAKPPDAVALAREIERLVKADRARHLLATSAR